MKFATYLLSLLPVSFAIQAEEELWLPTDMLLFIDNEASPGNAAFTAAFETLSKNNSLSTLVDTMSVDTLSEQLLAHKGYDKTGVPPLLLVNLQRFDDSPFGLVLKSYRGDPDVERISEFVNSTRQEWKAL